MEEGQVWRQYAIAGIANIGITSVGFSMGWTSPINEKLSNDTETPLSEPITPNQGAWIGSLINIGAIFGPFIAGYLSARIGRKWSILCSGFPLLIGWILIAAAYHIDFIYAGRILWGVGAGMLFTVVPMYCAEISTIDSRGALGSFLQIFITTGIFMVYAVGPFLSYIAVAYVGIAIVAVFVSGFSFMPESPIYYLIKNDKKNAAKSLMTIRGMSREDIANELMMLEVYAQESMNSKTATFAHLFRGSNFKAFYISCALVFFQQFSGINAVLFYLTNIFKAAGSDLDPAVASIIIGAVSAIASLTTSCVVDRLGRRILLLISTAGTAICLGSLGLFYILDEHESPAVQHIRFLPILSLVVFILTFSWGLGPLPWAIIGEIFPIEVKTFATPIATALCWVLSFLVTRNFEPVARSLGMYTAFWMFGVFCAGGFLFTLLVVPETKGKSFQQIQDILAGRPHLKKEVILKDVELD